MSDGRSNKPLFELLRDGPDSPVEPPARPEQPAAPSTPTRGRSVQVPMSTLYIGVALVLGLVLLAWVGGHKFGLEEGRREMSGVSTPETLTGLVIQDPTAEPSDQSSLGWPAEESRAALVPEEEILPVTPVTREEGDIIAATGMLADDPREALVNYLVLATLDEGSAVEAVQFLATRGIEAVAVPTGTEGVYRLISLDSPVPSGQFRELTARRRDLESRVRACGQEWLRGHGGSSDFSSTMWALYEP